MGYLTASALCVFVWWLRESLVVTQGIWKGIFWFCFAVSVSEKSTISLSLLVALFSALTVTEALPYPRLVVALTLANHAQTPSHSPLAFARAGCFGVVCVRLVASREFSGDSRNMDCAKAQTNLYVLAPPALCAHRGPFATRTAPASNQ